MRDLFGNEMPELVIPERALTRKERRKLLYGQISTVPKGHAAKPGTGPAGHFCRDCRHLVRHTYAKSYLKCLLARDRWTGGGGSDVRARDPACSKWEKPE